MFALISCQTFHPSNYGLVTWKQTVGVCKCIQRTPCRKPCSHKTARKEFSFIFGHRHSLAVGCQVRRLLVTSWGYHVTVQKTQRYNYPNYRSIIHRSERTERTNQLNGKGDDSSGALFKAFSTISIN